MREPAQSPPGARVDRLAIHLSINRPEKDLL